MIPIPYFIFLMLVILAPCPGLANGVYPGGGPLQSMQWFDQQPALPPLNTSVLLARKTTHELCDDCVGSALTLIYEQGESGNTVNPWPFYVQLDTSHASGAATGSNARIYNRSTGWAASHHSEGIAYSAGSTNIGFNAEMSPLVDGARLIGLNVLAKDGYAGQMAGLWSTEAINIQNDQNVGWTTGIKFDRTRMENGIEFSPESSATRAIWLRGKFGAGLDVGSNNIRMNAGAKVCFEETDQICMRYNGKKARLEFVNGSSVFAYLSVTKGANANAAKASYRSVR